MKVLIIDDAMIMRNIHKSVLKMHNFTDDDLFDAEDGSKALALAKENNIGLFLVDWNMPCLNGLDFVKSIRKLKKYKNTPIIMITAEAAKYNVMEAIEAGVTNYIIKPIKGDELWKKISKYIGVENKQKTT